MSPYLTSLLCLWLIGCAPTERRVNTGAKDSAVEVFGGERLISDIDVRKIIGTVRTIPNIDHNVLSMKAISSNEVEVTTGKIHKFGEGGGNTVILRRFGDGWKWHDDGVIRGWLL
jgi:hypothetical protein